MGDFIKSMNSKTGMIKYLPIQRDNVTRVSIQQLEKLDLGLDKQDTDQSKLLKLYRNKNRSLQDQIIDELERLEKNHFSNFSDETGYI